MGDVGPDEANEGGRVVRIISERELVVNLGREDGIQVGDKLEVYEEGEPVIDPETQEDLGLLRRVKAVVVVRSVDELKCIVASEEKVREVDVAPASVSPFRIFTTATRRIRERPPLPVDEAEIERHGMSERIRRGDKVRKVQ